MFIEEIIQGNPLLNNGFVSLEPLNGGLNNQTFKVITEKKSFVVRINGKQNEYLNVTRSSEVEIMKKAAREGFAPKVITAHNQGRYVVTEFIDGQMISSDDLNTEHSKKLIISHLKKIHAMKDNERQCSPYHFIERYISGADELNVKHPKGLSPFLKKAEVIAQKRSDDKQFTGRFCHNDYFTVNMISSGPLLYIIDWEMSGSGDIFFDLATIPFSCRFSEEQEKEWLKLYFETYEEEQFQILQELKFMHMVRECAWGMFYSGIDEKKVNHDFNYYKHTLYVLERLQRGINYL